MEMAIANPPMQSNHLTSLTVPVNHEDRRSTAQRVANEMFSHQPDWITFFREVLGVDGLLRKLFATPEELAAFEKTAEYTEIQQMLARLREKTAGGLDDKEPTRVITVRLPKSLHESLKTEAHDRNTSMNQLCISKLLQVIEAEGLATESQS
jgi:predicted HicB family RNase H-like nuclease